MGMTRRGFKKFLANTQSVLDELWGGQVEIKGVVYPAAVSAVSSGGTGGLGGDVPEGVVSIRIRKIHLPDRPKHGETLVRHDGFSWRVDDVRSHDVDEVWFLRCIPADE